MKKLLLISFALVLVLLQQAMAQGKTVTGTVTDQSTGDGLPGVAVLVKGTTVGVATGADGSYSINVPAEGNTLQFRFIGYTAVERSIGNASTINVAMSLDNKQLQEVVVTALGIQREKKDLGYSVGTVNAEELIVGRPTNVVNALSGKVAGVKISSASGMVGSSSGIFIRGNTTFTGNNQPLFVVDGVPIDNGGGDNALQNGVSNSNRAIDLNQDDIESINILKGPAAAALYGSRAASGAVIITTKKGKAGQKNRLEFNSSYNLVDVNRFPDWQNEYAQGTGGNFIPTSNVSWGPRIAGQTVTNFRGEQEALTAYPDNIKDIFKTGTNRQNTLSFSGGGDKASYRLSYGNTAERGILDNNSLDRNNFTFNGSSAITSKLTSGINFQYVNSNSERTQVGNQLSNPFFRGWFIPRNINLSGIPYQDEAGNQIYFDAVDNPYWTIANNTYEDEVNRVIGNVNFTYDLLPWLSANYRLGVDAYNFVAKGYDQIGARGAANVSALGTGGIYDQSFLSRNVNSNFILSGSRDLNDDFKLSFNVGNEVVHSSSKNVTVTGKTLGIKDLKNISNASVVTGSANRDIRRLVGLFADVTVGYKNFVTLNMTGRNDFSSTFGEDENSYFYPSVAVSFIATEAFPALKNNVIEFAKIKANYAKVGKEAPSFSTNTYFVQAGASDGFGPAVVFPYNGLGGRTLSNASGDPNLRPEFTTSKEIGLEMQFFKNRLGFEANYYQTNSEDLIFAVPISSSSGFTSQTKNAGTLENKGIEFLLNASPVKSPNFSWDVSFNFTRNRSEVLQLADGVPNIILAGFTTPNIRLEAGQPYGVMYGSAFLRNDNGQLIINNTTGLPSLDPISRKIGDTNPDWTGGITNNLNFKGINFNFLIDIRKGGDVYSRNLGDLIRSGSVAETAEFDRFNADGTLATPYIFEGVKADGSPNTTPVTTEQYFTTLHTAGESYVYDATWIRLREASISYSVPSAIVQKTPFGRLEIGLNGRNLLMRAPNFPHLDPENNTLGVSNAQGFEFNGLPQTRSYGAFLRVTL
ncbi:SusC/RagA family TonB-linked outer membrane protein [Pontibacter arcticus]|uniref:SusC/RagA family TonB-linked outer membrane protein n=1 Tax=Pontibacter arcticus TaxID=2080288 RepID=A0A364RHG4_9BACT|nr:SusC/RagA family TonB-linked outer membrane protein [Pontibacter arcticus]RAU83636.1 SusC/RagA family TonB-linked outer membrane protein [Pontibacter arcticus]